MLLFPEDTGSDSSTHSGSQPSINQFQGLCSPWAPDRHVGHIYQVPCEWQSVSLGSRHCHNRQRAGGEPCLLNMMAKLPADTMTEQTTACHGQYAARGISVTSKHSEPRYPWPNSTGNSIGILETLNYFLPWPPCFCDKSLTLKVHKDFL